MEVTVAVTVYNPKWYKSCDNLSMTSQGSFHTGRIPDNIFTELDQDALPRHVRYHITFSKSGLCWKAQARSDRGKMRLGHHQKLSDAIAACEDHWNEHLVRQLAKLQRKLRKACGYAQERLDQEPFRQEMQATVLTPRPLTTHEITVN